MTSTDGIEFWFDFASTYSYISALRIDALSESAGVRVHWRPFLLGPIFAKQGLNTSPFLSNPEKGNYMRRDISRRCARYGLPEATIQERGEGTFPQKSLKATLMAIAALQFPWGRAFCRDVFLAEFSDGKNIGDPAVLQGIALNYPDSVPLINAMYSSHIRATLRKSIEAAISLQIFGAPTFIVGGEMFWGDDRLEDALEWPKKF